MAETIVLNKKGLEVFFHRSALAVKGFDALEEGTSVEFDLERGPGSISLQPRYL